LHSREDLKETVLVSLSDTLPDTLSDTLFYDASCPLCRREVALLQRIARPTLAFQDLHTARNKSLPSREALLQSLHLQRASGEMVTGLAANVAVWQHTRFGAPWRLLMLPGIRALAERAYDSWARRRYARLYGCALSDPDKQ
jgi:predicted DCC family thiol-disulfide oxidoreductase YuxK